MKKGLLLGLALWAGTLAASDLWISILSLPPEPGIKAFGIYAHCPNSERQVRLELYEITDLIHKKKIADYEAEAIVSGANLNLVVREGAKTPLSLSLDRSKSFALKPLTYRTTITLDPNVYALTPSQSRLTSMLSNPEYPETHPRPIWNEPLSDCVLP